MLTHPPNPLYSEHYLGQGDIKSYSRPLSEDRNIRGQANSSYTG